jgi:hypothetical protein
VLIRLELERLASVTEPSGWCVTDTNSGRIFRHESDSKTSFRYPVPLCDPGSQVSLAAEAFYLSFRTRRGIFAIRGRAAGHCGVFIYAGKKRVGDLRLHNVDGFHEIGLGSSQEFIAISAVQDISKFCQHSSGPSDTATPLLLQWVDYYNVLWIKRDGAGHAYRLGLGQIEAQDWHNFADEKEVEVILR